MRPSKLFSSNPLIKVISILYDAAAAAFTQQPSTMKLLFAVIKKKKLKDFIKLWLKTGLS